MAGGAQAHLTGANRLSTLTFDNGGGGGIVLNAGGVLTLTGGIVATSTNATASAVIGSQSVGSSPNGVLNLNGNNGFSMNVAAASVAGRDIAPLTPTLIINSAIQNGGIAKSGNGLLQLAGQSDFTGGVSVTAGGLVIGASTTPIAGGFTGPFGTGTVTMATGTRLLASAANFTVQNAFVFGDDGAGTGSFVFGGLNNITLSGTAQIPSVLWNVEVTAPQTTVSINDVTGDTPTSSIFKTGLGTLNVGGFEGDISATGGLSVSADGNGRGTVENVAQAASLNVLGDLSVTVNRSGSAPFARNKVIQRGTLTVPAVILSVSNQSGFGLEFTGTSTMTGGAPTHFAVGVASASNLNSGLILSGSLTDGANTVGIIKSGPGTLELRGTNDFGGAGQTIDLLGGVLSVASDAALGDAANTVTLNADGQAGVGFRAIGSFSSGRTFILNQANNAFEVTAGRNLTLSQPFTLGGGTSLALAKNDNGVLTLSAANGTWNGTVNVNAGALRVANSSALGTSVINVAPNAAAFGAALQLAGVTLANTINLQGTGNQTLGGLDFGGQLSSFSGTNTLNGAVNFAFDAVLGVAAGSTLNLTGSAVNSGGALTNTVGQRSLILNVAGTLNVSSPITASSGATNLYNVVKYGAGTMNITTSQTFAIDTANGQWFNIRGGEVVLSGGSLAATTAATPTGTIGSATIGLTGADTVTGLGLRPGMFVAGLGVPTRATVLSVDPVGNTFVVSSPLTAAPTTSLKFLSGGTLLAPTFLDRGARLVLDSRFNAVSGVDNITANGRLGTSEVDARDIVFRGGELHLRGSTIVADGITEWVNRGLFRRGASTITLEMNLSNRLTLAFAGAPDNAVSPAQNAATGPQGSSVLFRGNNFGVSNDPGNSNVVFVNGVTIIGQNGGVGGTTKGILPWAVVGRTDAVQPVGTDPEGYSFATISTSTGAGSSLSGDRIIRPLGTTEYSNANIATGLDNNNLLFNANATTSIAANASPNSLTIEGGADITLAAGVRLALQSGGVLVRNGSVSVISGGVMNQVNTSAPLNIWTIGTAQLTISSAMSGGNGVSNGAISTVKAGAGTLVIAPPTAQVNGLAGLGTNSLSGQVVINQGTVRLGTGVKNALQANNYLSVTGGTLDLNGNSQQVFALFADQAWANSNGTITSSSGTGSLIINQDNNARNWAGAITGNVNVTRQGQNTFTLFTDMPYVGSTLINGGDTVLRDEAALSGTSSLKLQFGRLFLDNATSTKDLASRLNDAAPVSMRGGHLEFRGRAQAGSVENVGAVTLDAGHNFLVVSAGGTGVNSADLNLASLTRLSGAGTVNFTGASGQAGSAARITIGSLNGVSTATVGAGLTNDILGGWAIIGTSDFASYIPGLGVGPLGANGFPAYSPATVVSNTTLATNNIKLNTGASTITANVTVNSLATSNVAVGTVAINGGSTLTVGSGGILSFTDTSWSIGSAVGNGFLTSGTDELFLYAQGAGVMTINSVITGAVGVTKFGANTVAFGGLHTYTGGTTVSQGTLTVNAGSRIPLAADPAKGLVLNNVTFTQSFAGAVDAGNIVTLNGGSVVNYFDSNAQAGLAFNNLGGTGNPTVRTFNNANPANRAGSTGVLTIGDAGITVTSANVGTTAILEGRVDFGATAKTINVAAIDVNGVADVSPLQASLVLHGIVGSSGGLNKTGNGVLQLNGQANFTGAFNLNAGGLRNGVTNAGSRFSRLTLADGTRYDLNNSSTAWGSLAGTGDIFTGAAGTPTLTVGFDGTSSTFAGRFVAFNDIALTQLTKVGSGVLRLTSAQSANGSWGTIAVNGGTLAYEGSGAAFQSASAASAGTFNANSNGILQLDNSGTAVNHRLGLSQFGTVNVQGGRFLISDHASTAVTERVTSLNMLNGGGRVELSASGAGLTLSVGTLSGGNNTGSMVIAGITGNAVGAGFANLSINTPNYVQVTQQGGLGGVATANGSTNMIVRGDILADASATGLGTGFLVRDTVLREATTTNNSAVISVPTGTAGILVGASVTAVAGIPGGSFVTAVDSVNNTVTINNGTGVAPQTQTVTFGNYFRPLADAELNYLSSGATGWRQAENAGVFASQTAAQTIGVDTIVNTLTFSGAATSLGSSLGSSFGRFGQGGRLLTQEFRGATAFLVRSGTTDINVGSFTSNTGVTLFGHVLAGATANINSSFGLNQTSGFVKAGGGTLNLNALTYFTGGTFTVNGGTVNLLSGLDNTVAVAVRADSAVASNLQVNATNAVLDLRNRAQAFGSIASANGIAGGAGTITNTGASIVNLISTGGGTFSGVIAGNLNFIRMGNNTTTLTNAQAFSGEAVVRGGTLLLQDAGTLSASAVRAFYGAINLENFGFNPSAGSLPVRIPPAAPVTLQGGTIQVGGTGSTDTITTFNRINLEGGANQLNPQPYVDMGGTVRVNVGNLVRTTANRPTLNMVGWTTRNGGTGVNTLGQQGLSRNSNIFFTQVNSAAFSAASVVNNLIGGWAVASGDTFAGYSDTFGVTQMGQANAAGFTGTDFSAATVATGNYNDGTSRTLSGARVAYSLRMAPAAAQTMTFSAGASLTLGVGIITNAGQTITLSAADAANFIEGASGADLYFYHNQGTGALILQPRITGAGAVVSFGGGIHRLEPTFASNDYTGGTFANGGVLSLNAAAGRTAVPSGQRWFSATTINPTTTTVQLATVAGLSVGSTFVNPNFPAGTTVTAIDVPTNTVTLSATSTNVAAAASQVIRSNALNTSLANFVGLTIHNSTVSTVGNVTGQIDPATNVVINGGGRLVLNSFDNMVAGTNVSQSLRSLVYNNEGGGGNPDVDIGNPNDYVQGTTPNYSILVLTADNPIVATNNNLTTTPTIYGSDAARTSLQFSAASPTITVNSGLAPTGMRILATITQNAGMTGPIVKNGAGALALTSAESTFSTGFDLTAGSLIIGGSSDLPVITKGPLGTGTLTVRSGTSLFSDNTIRTLHNAVSVLGDFEFGNRLAGSGLILAGAVDLGATAKTISITHPNVVSTLSGAVTSTVGAGVTGLTKTGDGTLALGGSLNFGGAGIAVTGGVLRTTALNVLPASTPLALSAGAGLDLFGNNQAVETVTGSGFITNSFNGPANLALGGASNSAFAGVIADNGANLSAPLSRLNLIKDGAGELTLTGANLYLGTTAVNAGTLIVGPGGSLGLGAVTVDAALSYARTDAFTVPNQFGGIGTISFLGVNGVAKLTGDSIGTSIASLVIGPNSVLQFGDGGTTGALSGATSMTMGAGSVLRFNRTDAGIPDFTTPITSVATSRIEQAGTGKTKISGAGFIGDVVVNAGELEAAALSAFELANSITINANGTFTAVDGALGYGTGGVAPDVTINGGLMRLFDGGNATNNGVNDLVLNGGTVSSGTGSLGASSLYVVGAVSVTNDATISAQNVAFVNAGTAAVATDITVNATKTLTFSGTIADDTVSGYASAFDKKGAGTLVLSGDNSGMTGASAVSAGVVDVRHTNALGDGTTAGPNLTTGSLTVGAGGVIVSNQANFVTAGAVLGNITVSTGGSIGVAAPGAAVIGNLKVASLTLQSGSNIELKIWDHAQGAGLGYDKLDLGTLDLTGVTSSNRVTIKLISMSAANAFGNSTLVKPTDPVGFRSFDIGTYDNTPGVNVSDLFRFDATQFTYANGSASDAGLWMVNFNDGTGAITLTAVPEPSTYGFGLGALALAAAALRRRRQTKKA